jgi:hypothetical protein
MTALKDMTAWKASSELEAFKALAALHNVQETIFWTRSNILAVIQTALLAGAFSVWTSDRWQQSPVSRLVAEGFVCVAGLFIAILWVKVVRRTDYLFQKTLYILSDMEREGFKMDRRFMVFSRFAEETNPLADEAGRANGRPADPTAPRLMQIWLFFGQGFAILWLVGLFVLWVAFLRGVH